MHTTRRALRRFARSLNFRDFNVSFVQRGALGLDPRPLTSNKNNTAVPFLWNIADQDSTRNSALSRTFARDFSTATAKKPPEPQGLPVFGTMLALISAGGAEKLHEYVDKRHRELGPVYREQIGPVRAVFVNSPDEYRKILIDLAGPTPLHFLPESWQLYNELRAKNRGLLFMDGQEWWRHRQILNKVMLKPDPMKFLCAPCQEAAKNLAEKWKTYSRAGCTVPDLQYQLYQWSIEVMLATMIGSRWRDCKPQLRSDIEYVAMMVHQIFKCSATLSMIPAKLAMKLRLPVWTQFVKTVDTVLDRVHNLVPEMIQMSDGDGLMQIIINHGISSDMTSRIITDFIIAAGDTTSVTMQWVLLLLSSHPELQNQLFHNIKDLSVKETLQHQLLRSIWREALRLHPVAPFLTRYLPTDAIIGDYLVPKGELIIISLYSSSRDEKYFLRPNEFWPERWIKIEKLSGTSSHYQGVKDARASIPFAVGLRNCIGRRLAETQLSLTLAELIKNFKIECENRDSIEMILHMVSVPSKPIKLKLSNRET
ncbi:cytochrome P450 315a1, mitochondrial [Monomorium pharaonis]|uniref:cytochrome P450 315a1, mitochondrial n=1 Tax=Monomorium pharaonis TaxID=307658 RepID=UPI00063F7195|nr:cytochrome P450 315a1, mitochondrial [Monomorium pharaonis]XP_036149506.1 cytochrome P450 315a1, mitochondrial [Monomorium pharaonis]XP_036149507.1 cytochrome P450 315a1, mitochondrial [Monomorium pharaonis]XP_036149508.1 cytochrome P450 315a1, mitochondrial [Monomorium pharaonis]